MGVASPHCRQMFSPHLRTTLLVAWCWSRTRCQIRPRLSCQARAMLRFPTDVFQIFTASTQFGCRTVHRAAILGVHQRALAWSQFLSPGLIHSDICVPSSVRICILDTSVGGLCNKQGKHIRIPFSTSATREEVLRCRAEQRAERTTICRRAEPFKPLAARWQQQATVTPILVSSNLTAPDLHKLH